MTWDEMVRVTKANCRGEVTTAVVDAVLRALIANGYAIVPREATGEMRAVGDRLDVARAGVAYLWSAALSAGEIKPEEQKT